MPFYENGLSASGFTDNVHGNFRCTRGLAKAFGMPKNSLARRLTWLKASRPYQDCLD